MSGFIGDSVSNEGSDSESLKSSGKDSGSTFHYEEYVRELNGRGISHPNPNKYARSSKIDGDGQKAPSCAEKRNKTRRHVLGRFVIVEFESEEEPSAASP